MIDADRRTAWAPGRVNLIGDHTDYAGGLVLPMAIDLGTTFTLRPGGTVLTVTSGQRQPLKLDVPVRKGLAAHLAGLEPAWGRYVAAMAVELGATTGGRGELTTTLPVGAGLSSSSSLEVATALALGYVGQPLELARLAQRAERAASGVQGGIMDQLVIAAGRSGHGLLIDCATERYRHVPIPPEVEVWVAHSGVSRRLSSSGYSERRDATERAARLIGPLPTASAEAIESLEDPVLRRRARHVRSECDRVEVFAAALAAGDSAAAGAAMVASHNSLRDDFDVSVPALDTLVESLCERPDVFGARLTGAGFGGCVVALARAGSDLGDAAARVWRVRPSDGARLIDAP
ncbi:MAG: galactokinase family protein [Microthrixaceae bacterium]